jgi:hypothetical protein
MASLCVLTVADPAYQRRIRATHSNLTRQEARELVIIYLVLGYPREALRIQAGRHERRPDALTAADPCYAEASRGTSPLDDVVQLLNGEAGKEVIAMHGLLNPVQFCSCLRRGRR